MSSDIRRNMSSLSIQSGIANNQSTIANNRSKMLDVERQSSGYMSQAPQKDTAASSSIAASSSQKSQNSNLEVLRTADSSAGKMNNILVRMREIAVESSHFVLSDSNREFLNRDTTQFVRQLESLSAAGKIDGSSGALADARVSTLFSNSSIDISTKDSARASLSTIDGALKKMDDIRSSFAESIKSIGTVSTTKQTATAESKIKEVDTVSENASISKQQILQSPTAKLSEANTAQKTGMGRTLDLLL